MINRGKKSKNINNNVKNISKNPQSFLETSPVQEEVLLLHKLQEHAYE